MDAEWILRAQAPTGPSRITWIKTRIWPYLSNFAAQGLAQATRTTGNQTYVNAAWRWLTWYQNHMDGNGFVTDYTLQGGVAAFDR